MISAMTNPKQPANKQERAYQMLRSRIENGEFGPGQRVIIDSLAREFGMSQVPIREAIRRLEASGWIVYHRNSGPVVAQVTRERWEEGMMVLAVVEGYATALAAPHMTAADLTKLVRLNKAMAASLKALDLIETSQANREFHSSIYSRCPNHYLVEQLIEIQAQLDAIRGAIVPSPQRISTSFGEHEAIIKAIKEGKRADHIERLCREHRMNTIRAAGQYIGRRAN
jgi:DNA-binding GntR family transcriptional regulator